MLAEMPEQMMTIGEVAAALDVPVSRLKHALTRFPVEPAGIVGKARVWPADRLPQIVASLEATSQGRRGRRHG